MTRYVEVYAMPRYYYKWTQDEIDQLVRLVPSQQSYKQIARSLGRSPAGCRAKARTLKLSYPRRGLPTPPGLARPPGRPRRQLPDLVPLIAAGLSRQAIARRLVTSPRTIARHLREMEPTNGPA